MSGRNPGGDYDAALERSRHAERAMLRAFHRWEKYREALARAEKRLDEAMRASSPAGDE